MTLREFLNAVDGLNEANGGGESNPRNNLTDEDRKELKRMLDEG